MTDNLTPSGAGAPEGRVPAPDPAAVPDEPAGKGATLVQVSLGMPAPMVAIVDIIAEATGMTRSETIRRLVQLGAEAAIGSRARKTRSTSRKDRWRDVEYSRALEREGGITRSHRKATEVVIRRLEAVTRSAEAYAAECVRSPVPMPGTREPKGRRP